MKELKLQNFAGEGVGKLKRSHLIHYIDASFGDGEPKWFLIGKDVEDIRCRIICSIMERFTIAAGSCNF